MNDELSQTCWECRRDPCRCAALAAPKEAGDAFERAMKASWEMVDPRDSSAPGSYYKGHNNGVIAALQTVRANYDIERSRLAAPSKEAVPAGEFLGWVREYVWKDGTSRSLHQREPKLMDAIEPDGSPLAGLVSQRIVRVYANPPGDQRQEGEIARGLAGIAADLASKQEPGWPTPHDLLDDDPASPPPEAAAAVGDVIENAHALVKWLTSEAKARRDKDDLYAGCFDQAAGYVNDLVGALASPTGVDEAMVEAAATVLWGYAGDMRANEHMHAALTAALAARDGGADHG